MHRSMALIGQAKMKLATWYCACTKQLDKFYLHFSWHCQELAKSLKETNKTKQQGDENSLCSSAMMIGYLVDHNDVSVILLPPWKLLLDNNEYLLSLIKFTPLLSWMLISAPLWTRCCTMSIRSISAATCRAVHWRRERKQSKHFRYGRLIL